MFARDGGGDMFGGLREIKRVLGMILKTLVKVLYVQG